MRQEALDIERSHRGEWVQGKWYLMHMLCGNGLELLQSSGEFPCDGCHTWVENSIYCVVARGVHNAKELFEAD